MFKLQKFEVKIICVLNFSFVAHSSNKTKRGKFCLLLTKICCQNTPPKRGLKKLVFRYAVFDTISMAMQNFWKFLIQNTRVRLWLQTDCLIMHILNVNWWLETRRAQVRFQNNCISLLI